jgi:hypothetical protein
VLSSRLSVESAGARSESRFRTNNPWHTSRGSNDLGGKLRHLAHQRGRIHHGFQDSMMSLTTRYVNPLSMPPFGGLRTTARCRKCQGRGKHLGSVHRILYGHHILYDKMTGVVMTRSTGRRNTDIGATCHNLTCRHR